MTFSKWITGVALAAFLAVPVAAAQPQDRSEVALRAAMEKETVEGDVKGAIEQYKKLAQSANRTVAARALVRLGECYDKLGEAQAKEARAAYERVVSDFADQGEAVTQARARLAAKAAASAPPAAPSQALLWKAGPALMGGAYSTGASADGSFVVYARGRGLWRHDFGGGEDRIIQKDVSLSTTAASVYWPKVSPDGGFVAYTCHAIKELTELRVVGMDGSGMRVLAKTEKPGMVLAAEAWSPDGRQLLVHREKELALLSVADGSLTVVQPGAQGAGSTPNAFSPDGRFIVYHSVADNETDPAKQRYVIWIMDAAGGGATQILSDSAATSREPMWAPDGRSVLFQSNRSGTAALWSIAMADGKAQGSPQPVSRDVLSLLRLTQDGSLMCTRSIQESDIYVAGLDPATLKVTSAPQRLNQRYIGAAGGMGFWSPDGHSFAYTHIAGGTGGPIDSVLVHSMDTNEEREIKIKLSQSASRILRYSPDGQSWLAGRSPLASGLPGSGSHFSRIDVQTGKETALFDVPDVNGGVLSPDERTLYYSLPSPFKTIPDGESRTEVVRVVRRDLQSGKETDVIRLDVKSISPQLQLSPDGQRVAFRYKGVDNRVWLAWAPTEGGAVRQVAEVAQMGLSVWTPDSRQLQPVDVSQLRTSAGFTVTVSLQNDRVAFVMSRSGNEVWLYKNLVPPAPAQQ